MEGIDFKRIKDGDEAAFKRLFTELYPKLMGVACRFVDRDEAEDLVQGVFSSYYEQRENIEADDIVSFLFKWLRNDCINYVNHKVVVDNYAARTRIAKAREEFLMQNSEDNETFERLMHSDFYATIEQSLAKLPPKCAEAFRLCYLDDLSRDEVAESMGISRRTVEQHIYKALDFLRKDLKDVPLYMLLLYYESHTQ